MRPFWIPALLAAVAVLSTSSWAVAQPKWVEPYRRGLTAIKAEQWQNAIEALTSAVAVESSAGQKQTEGVFTDPYYPQFYLALAYARTKQWSLASQYLNIALKRAKLTPLGDDERRLLPALQEEIRVANLNPEFGVAAGKAEAALGEKRYAEAIRQFTEARLLDDGTEFDRRKLGDRLKEAGSGYREEIRSQIVAGRALLNDPNKLDEARAAFQAIEKRLADEKDVADAVPDVPRADLAEALKTVAQREGEYRNAVAAADQAEKARRLEDAGAAYAKAVSAYPQQAVRDKLADRQSVVRAGLALQAQLDSAQRAYTAGNFDEAVKIATAVLNIDATRQDMLALRSRAESRIAFRDGTAAVGQRRYADAEKKFVEAVEKDRDNTQAADALGALREFAGLMEQARRLAAEKKYAEAYQALDQLQVKDQARFEAEGLGTLRQTLQQQQADEERKRADAEQRRADAKAAAEKAGADKANADKANADKAKEAARNAALGELTVAKQAAQDGETDRACKILEQLRNLPDGVLSNNDEAEVWGYLCIAYFQRSLERSRAAEKPKWEGQAVLMFREARARNRKWQPPPAFGKALAAFLADKAQ